MDFEKNRIGILIGISVIISAVFQYISKGSLMPDIMDIAIGYFIINSLAYPKPKENKIDAPSKLIPIEKYGLIIASIVLMGLSVLPWFMFANFKITTVISMVVFTALKIGAYCGAGVAYRKYVLKNSASSEQDRREEIK